MTAGMVLALVGLGALGCAPDAPADPPADDSAEHLVVEQTPEQQRRTLASLRLLDDHPLLMMTHHGPAPRPAAVTPRPAPDVPDQAAVGYACTVFAAVGDQTRPVVGRNFDWDHHQALVLLADPPDAYASVSVVDISYLGYQLNDAAALVTPDADPERRRNLLRAVTLPFDGMNEHGLVVGMAALDDARPAVRPGRPTVGSIGIMRLLLDHARTVAEAAALIDRYNIDFTGGPPLHYFVADADGNSAVIEFVDGETRALPREGPWQLMVNFQLAGATTAERTADWRWRDGTARLEAERGRLDWRESLELLRDLRQGHTQWSAVYEPRTGEVRLATGQRYDHVHQLRVPGR